VPEGTESRRGRPPRPEPAEPTGYRCTASIRRQIQLAIAFTGESNVQAVIDRAVQDYLLRLRIEVDGFAAAAEAAEAHATGAPGNVTRIPRNRR
jgi:hypothetical protein